MPSDVKVTTNHALVSPQELLSREPVHVEDNRAIIFAKPRYLCNTNCFISILSDDYTQKDNQCNYPMNNIKLMGADAVPKTDEFSETFQTAFDPSSHFRKIMLQFFHNIMLRKPCLKVQNLQHKLDRKHSPYLEVFLKFIRFGDTICPSVELGHQVP